MSQSGQMIHQCSVSQTVWTFQIGNYFGKHVEFCGQWIRQSSQIGKKSPPRGYIKRLVKAAGHFELDLWRNLQSNLEKT